MGFNATVVVLVDQLDDIANDPHFGRKLADAIVHKANDPNNKYGFEPYVTGQTQVVEVHHADQQVIVAVGGNCGQVIGFGGGYSASPDEMIKTLNAQRLRRERERKAEKQGQEQEPNAPQIGM